MRIEDAIELLEDINVVAKTKHMCRSMDDELEEGETQVYRDRFEAVKMGKAALEKQINLDFIQVVRCKDCIHWQDRQIKLDDGSYRDYLPKDGLLVPCSVGINIGSHCTLRKFEIEPGLRLWMNGNDFCSRGVAREEE